MLRPNQARPPSDRRAPTWYSFLLTGFYIYTVNVQGNVVPFLQAEFALSYSAVSLQSSAIARDTVLATPAPPA